MLGNDEDIDSRFSIDSFTQPENGLVDEGGEGDFVYTPNENYVGEDSFTYTITDGEFTDTATVTITVGSVNDLPVANDDLGVEAVEDTPITIDVTVNDTDVEDEPGDLTITILDEPANGSVALVEGGVEYTPNADYNGEDSFTYKVTDTDDGTSAEAATVTINVSAVNDEPGCEGRFRRRLPPADRAELVRDGQRARQRLRRRRGHPDGRRHRRRRHCGLRDPGPRMERSPTRTPAAFFPERKTAGTTV